MAEVRFGPDATSPRSPPAGKGTPPTAVGGVALFWGRRPQKKVGFVLACWCAEPRWRSSLGGEGGVHVAADADGDGALHVALATQVERLQIAAHPLLARGL